VFVSCCLIISEFQPSTTTLLIKLDPSSLFVETRSSLLVEYPKMHLVAGAEAGAGFSEFSAHENCECLVVTQSSSLVPGTKAIYSTTYQVYLASLVGQKYEVLVRFGNKVQEVLASNVKPIRVSKNTQNSRCTHTVLAYSCSLSAVFFVCRLLVETVAYMVYDLRTS
jgi:hypothetical protein